MKENEINLKWGICTNCGSGHLEHFEFQDKTTKNIIKRVTHCKNCNLNIIEFFGEVFIQKNMLGIISEEDIKNFQNLPRA